jgi:hypothetical protein
VSLFVSIFHKETPEEKIRKLNFQRQKEVQKWEASSPDYARVNVHRWTLLDQDSRYRSHRTPRWIMRIAEKTWDNRMQKAVGVPIFLHKRFTTYKIDYNDYEGYLIFKGLKPSSITRIDSQLQQLHRKAR